jgi:pantetheine-phosphate adenylyltransferase
MKEGVDESMRVAVYAGSFDPITNGHLWVIKRSTRMFDRLFVVVAVNPYKQPTFTIHERIEMICDAVAHTPNVECTFTEGYVVAFAETVGARFLVRGVRTLADAESEIALTALNHALAPQIATVFVPAEPTMSEVSSSRLKELARKGEDLFGLCSPLVAQKLGERFNPIQYQQRGGTSDVAI